MKDYLGLRSVKSGEGDGGGVRSIVVEMDLTIIERLVRGNEGRNGGSQKRVVSSNTLGNFCLQF